MQQLPLTVILGTTLPPIEKSPTNVPDDAWYDLLLLHYLAYQQLPTHLLNDGRELVAASGEKIQRETTTPAIAMAWARYAARLGWTFVELNYAGGFEAEVILLNRVGVEFYISIGATYGGFGHNAFGVVGSQKYPSQRARKGYGWHGVTSHFGKIAKRLAKWVDRKPVLYASEAEVSAEWNFDGRAKSMKWRLGVLLAVERVQVMEQAAAKGAAELHAKAENAAKELREAEEKKAEKAAKRNAKKK